MRLQLPRLAHVPGSGTEPDRAALEALKAPCPATVSDDNWRDARPFRAGLELYARGYFWEAHEVWEPAWLATAPNSRERQLLAGLIQLANAGLKLRMRQWRAASRLMELASRHIAEADGGRGGHLMGIDVARLSGATAHWQAAIRRDKGQAPESCLAARPDLAAASTGDEAGHLR